jgi:hypothetical protein
MQTALDQFRANIGRVRALDGLYSFLVTQTGGTTDLSDLLRTQIVMVVSALDHYVHEATRLGMLEIMQGIRPATPAFTRFPVRMESTLLAVAASSSSAWLDDAIRAAHGHLSFQDPDKIGDAFKLITAEPVWERVGAALGIPAMQVKQEMKAIVRRRNQIAHEADLDPSYPGTLWPINATDVRTAVGLIERIVESIHLAIA